MFKQSFATLFLCLSFGAFSCTDETSEFLDDLAPQKQGKGDATTNGAGDAKLVSTDVTNPGSDDAEDAVNPGGDPSNPPEPVPEPMTMLLFGSGLAGVAYRYRRRRSEEDAEAEPAEA